MRNLLAAAAIAMMLLWIPADLSEAEGATCPELVTYEGFTYGYTTHFNDPGYDYGSDTYWSAAVSFDGDVSGTLMIQSSLEGYPLFRIESGAFSGCGATTVIVPERVRDICSGAFYGCDSLTDMYFMGDMPTIADGAIPAGVTFHCMQSHSASWGTAASVVSQEESGGVGFIVIDGEAYVCGRSPSAVSLTVPSEVDGVPVRCVMPWAFYSDTGITHVTVDCPSVEERSFMYCTSLRTLTLSDKVRDIDSEAFRGCSEIGSLELCSTRYIGFETFRDCSSLESIIIPDSVTSLGEGSFYICLSAVSVSTGSGVTHLAPRTFGYCSSLRDVRLGNVTSIGGYCFINDISIEDFRMPDTVVSVGESAFSGCRSMQMIHLSESLSVIGPYAFSGCRSLVLVTVPDTLSSIGGSAFSGCRSMTEAYFRGDMPEMGDEVFMGTAAGFRVKYDREHSGSWSGYDQTASEMVGGNHSSDRSAVMPIVTVLVAVSVAAVVLSIVRKRG